MYHLSIGPGGLSKRATAPRSGEDVVTVNRIDVSVSRKGTKAVPRVTARSTTRVKTATLKGSASDLGKVLLFGSSLLVFVIFLHHWCLYYENDRDHVQEVSGRKK